MAHGVDHAVLSVEPIKTRTSARKKTSQGRSISVLGGPLGMGDDQKLDWRFLGFEFQAQLLLQGGEKRGGIGVTGRPVEFEVVASFQSCPVDNNLLGISQIALADRLRSEGVDLDRKYLGQRLNDIHVERVKGVKWTSSGSNPKDMDFKNMETWLARNGRTPREQALKTRLRILTAARSR